VNVDRERVFRTQILAERVLRTDAPRAPIRDHVAIVDAHRELMEMEPDRSEALFEPERIALGDVADGA
jgi:hypothetical protein